VKAGLLHIGTPDRDNMLSFGLGRSRDADDNDVLNGMSNIDTHALAKVSLEGSGRDPSRPDWHYALTFSQDISDEHDGASIDAGIGYSWPLWERWKLTTEVGITWASDDFTQAHFGVTTSQANLSGNTAYTAESGIVEAWIKKRLEEMSAEGTPIPFTVKREDETVSVEVTPVPVCDYPFHVVQDDAVNATADSETMEVYTGMIRFVENDDELALILGHELAHNTMEHIQKSEGNYVAGALVGAVFGAILGVDLSGVGGRIGAGAFSQEFEAEADYVGVYYAARAGFDVSGVAKLWRRMAARNPGSIHLSGSTHPSSAKRFIAIEKTAEEVTAKKTKGEALVPETVEDGDHGKEN